MKFNILVIFMIVFCFVLYILIKNIFFPLITTCSSLLLCYNLNFVREHRFRIFKTSDFGQVPELGVWASVFFFANGDITTRITVMFPWDKTWDVPSTEPGQSKDLVSFPSFLFISSFLPSYLKVPSSFIIFISDWGGGRCVLGKEKGTIVNRVAESFWSVPGA